MAKNTKPIKKGKKLLKTSLVAAATTLSTPVNVGFRFASGIGQATASLFRNGVLINMQSISMTGNIHFADVQSGDVISVNGICTGTADITINVTTIPANPKHFVAGLIMANFLI